MFEIRNKQKYLSGYLADNKVFVIVFKFVRWVWSLFAVNDILSFWVSEWYRVWASNIHYPKVTLETWNNISIFLSLFSLLIHLIPWTSVFSPSVSSFPPSLYSFSLCSAHFHFSRAIFRFHFALFENCVCREWVWICVIAVLKNAFVFNNEDTLSGMLQAFSSPSKIYFTSLAFFFSCGCGFFPIENVPCKYKSPHYIGISWEKNRTVYTNKRSARTEKKTPYLWGY